MGQPSDLLASAPVGLRGALRDTLRLRTSVVVAGSSEIPPAVGVVERINRSRLPDAKEGRRSSDHQRFVSGSATRGGKHGSIPQRPFRQVDGIVLRSSEDPRPGPKEILMRVRASSLNYRDLMVLKGGGRGPTKLGVVPCPTVRGK